MWRGCVEGVCGDGGRESRGGGGGLQQQMKQGGCESRN